MSTRFSTLRQTWSSLSITDKLLPLAIILAMVLGILLSVYVPSSRNAFNGAEVVGVSAPLAVGLIIMMLPPLCKVRWESFFTFFSNKRYFRAMITSLVLNWIVCPFLMFGLAWLTLFDKKEYRNGIIMIGLARCIAMVLLWNDIAGGDIDLCAMIVIVNSVLQIILYAPYQLFFCYVITGDYHSNGTNSISYGLVAKSVLFFLGVPLGFGLVVRFLALFTVGLKTYEKKILPFISPWGFIGLMYTIIVIFIERGNDFIKDIGSGLRCFVPLTLYFAITWFGTFFGMRWLLGKSLSVSPTNTNPTSTEPQSPETEKLLCGCEDQVDEDNEKWTWKCGASYSETVTQTFTAASNNFELSLAIAISLYGSGSRESIAATFGPLLEVPILISLCFVAQYFKNKFLWSDIDRQGNSTDSDHN